jgi:hypothetical protein
MYAFVSASRENEFHNSSMPDASTTPHKITQYKMRYLKVMCILGPSPLITDEKVT